MGLVLKGPAVGPDGDRVDEGTPIPGHWPDWFVQDLRDLGHVEEGDETPAPALVGTPQLVPLEGTSDRGREAQ